MRALFPIFLLIGGGTAGAAGGYGVLTLLGKPSAAAQPVKTEATLFVPTGSILAPIVASDGHLSGYGRFEVQLEVSQSTEAEVTAKLPLFLHAVNLRTYKSPMASGPDDLMPELTLFRTILMQAAHETWGEGVVRNAAITAAAPA